MYLYKIEIELVEADTAHLIVLAETDEKAFGYVEENLARHFVAVPATKSIAIIQKKRIEAGAGYIIE
ncbi:DUF3906 family protein [Paenibacillus sp. y28]|uniref:DUF3906 family protein n=1 Tax=Paenibacillus sp. y28 TaxID=3129110 RepID=UPI003016B864